MDQNLAGRRKLAAIMSADAAGYSRLMGDDEQATVQTLSDYRTVFRERIDNFQGRVIDTAGDSVLADFGSVVEAVQCAVAVQTELASRNAKLPDSRRMHFRIGLNLGDVIEQDDGTIYGDGVNIAARIEASADLGGVCVSGSVFENADGKIDCDFAYLGEQQAKNIAKPVRVYKVNIPPPEAPSEAAADEQAPDVPSARKRAVSANEQWAVLVVDDNEDNRYTLTRRLKREGYTNLEIAINGRDALDKLGERKFDLVLLDIMMPEMNGYQVLEHVKADMDLRDIPVIMISAIDEMDSVAKCIELGAEDYLPKPFNAVLLRARIGACLEKKRLRDQQESQLARLEGETKRAETLLQAVFPGGVVRELKSTSEVRPRRFDDVAIVMCEIVDFGRHCAESEPDQVVSELRTLVDGFESIIAKHRLESIKNINGVFVATAGLFVELDDPTSAAVRCALDMIAASRRFEPRWRVRVGLHKGTVFAGILGRKYFSFDLWGEAITDAQQILQGSEPGTLTMSDVAWHDVRSAFKGRSLGQIQTLSGETLELVECMETD